ncbi:MAG TPA: M36 family metallopeptidase, partial [Pyrinomonadaceae bacterium]|nr:M36 family metallopeptidase [Pyrinomonadaceae bacterium]
MSNLRKVLLALFVFSIAAAILLLPFILRSSAQPRTTPRSGLFSVTGSHDDGLQNYDIRTDKASGDKLLAYRSMMGKTATQVTSVRDSFARGEESLRQRVPTLKVEYNRDLRIPEVIGPDVKQGKAFLTKAGIGQHAETLRTFLSENRTLIGLEANEVSGLKVTADYTNPEGDLSFVELEQEIGGVPVFRGEVKAGFTKKGEMIRVINNLAPGIANSAVSSDFGDPVDAVTGAAGSIQSDAAKLDLKPDKSRSTDIKRVFGKGDSATTAEKMYFPTEPGVVVPAWRVLIWLPVNAFYVIVDAKTGTMLWRKNLTEDQTQPATYGVYTNPNAMINVAHSPFPFSPGSPLPDGSQGASIGRTSVSRIGNEGLYTFNNLGWLPDGVIKTDGNNVQTGVDRDGSDGIDTNTEAVSVTRNFTVAYNPTDPNVVIDATTNGGDAPLTPANQTGAVINLFYICNWYHDETYRLGFTEQAKNFQDDNFGRGGAALDRVRGEAQDSSGTNNANFATGADGTRGKMQMYIFTGANPDIDGSLDADVVIHEHTHGLSNRLHGNGSGLFNDMSRGMGEGWSDFYGLSLLSQPNDPINAAYTSGAYASYKLSGTFTNNSYYGIRRFPYAIKSFVGANGMPHNPLTFADLDPTQANLTDGAFSPRFTGISDEVHTAGEVWCSMLWEVRARIIGQSVDAATGNRHTLQLVTDGMKLAPISPTFLQERDALVAAAVAGGVESDVADVWGGFAVRGLGVTASIETIPGASQGGTGETRVTQKFDLPNLTQTQDLSVSDTVGDNDGYAEPDENVTITVPITNSTGQTATSVTAAITGGGSGTYGTMGGAQTLGQAIAFHIPSNATCGAFLSITINANSSLGVVSFTRQIFVGKPATTAPTENFDGAAAPAFPSGWSVDSVQGGTNFVVTTNGPDTSPNAAFAVDPTTVGGATDLVSPMMLVSSASSTITFRHNYNTEVSSNTTWDGGVLEISVSGGNWRDIMTAGGSFTQNGYNTTLGVSTNNPLNGRPAWGGNSGGYITTTAQLPASTNGKLVQLRWRFGADDNGAVTGWFVDTVSLAGAGFVTSYACSVGPTSNPYDDAGFFVRQHYLDFLNREPDASGLAFWTGVITSCGSDAACTEVNRINVSAAYFLSNEFQNTGYLAYLTHRSAFGATAPGSPAPV